MSWLAKLYETYERGRQLAFPPQEQLMPISHTLQNAHINMVLDGDGNFRRATVLQKHRVVLPATEKSAGRTSGESPHPLADKIQYVAKDYPEFGGRKKSYFSSYEKLLADWCASPFSHPKAKVVYRYIRKGQVVADLVRAGIIFVDEENRLRAYWPFETDKEHPIPPIFKTLPTNPKNKRREKDQPEVEPGDALICWSVEVPGDQNSSTWDDTGLQQSWIDYYASLSEVVDFCYIQGEDLPLADNHPAKLRHTGDKAKLISSNDSSGFTFRGRFTDTTGMQALGVGYDVTQKAHNALRWLIARQGYRNGEQVYVTWAVSGKETPEPLKSSWELLAADNIHLQEERDDTEKKPDHTIDLGNTFALQFRKYMAGYQARLEPNEQIVVMGLDSATPGRMAIIYYRELLASEFLDRLERWHLDFAWPQRHTIEVSEQGKKKQKKEVVWPVCSPAPRTIADAAYGDILRSNETLKKNVLQRIVPCIVDGRHFPRDIMETAVRGACNRHNCEHWEWQRNLGVACALYKGYYIRHPNTDKRREYDMTLEKDRRSRDYLYGRLLAIAERIEEIALNVAGEKRPTTAARLMQRFADRPYSTWRVIEPGLQPYMQRLQSRRAGFLVNRQKDLDRVMSLFEPGDFLNDKALDGEFLLGYHCQRQHWRDTQDNDDKQDNDDNKEQKNNRGEG